MRKHRLSKLEGKQLALSFKFTAKQLKETGIKLAVDNSNERTPGWSQIAFEALRKYLQMHPPKHQFRCEQFREWYDKFDYPQPTHTRAFSAIMSTGMKNGLIKKLPEMDFTSNPKAHNARCYRYEKL